MKKLFLLLIGILSTVHLVNSQLFPVNHEVVYNYKGMVQTGTGEPITYVSDFAINAKVHVKGFDNYTLVTIEDMTHGLYSGKNNEFISDKMNFHDIPEQSKNIYKPFIIKYNKYGKTVGILTENDDNMWSVNIKKAIASLLQLNVHNLNSTTTKAVGFHSEEHTVYGICNVLYEVVLSESNKYNITKHINPLECKEYKLKTNFNIEAEHCDVEFESPISTFSYINYKVEQTDSGFFINSIKAKNNIYLNTLNGFTDTQFVLVDQSLDYEKDSEFSDAPKLDTINSDHKTKLHFLSHSSEDRLTTDVTGDRPESVDMDEAMKDAIKGLNNVVEHMRQHQVDLSISFQKEGRAIHFFLFKGRFLNEKYLRRIYKKLEDDSSEVGKDLMNAFLSAVPLLGTYESHIFILNLIWQEQVNEDKAIEMLKELPFNIKYYSKKIWKDFSHLTDSETNVTEPIRNTAMLTVSNLISRYNHMYPDDAVVTNYIDIYIDMFKNSKTEQEKIIMLCALTNIKAKKVLKFVNEIVQSKSEEITPHLKTLATFGFKDELLKNKDHLYKLYWPIFKNIDEDLELRCAAVTMLMSEASMETMLKMFWQMQSFASHAELYKVYYTAMESMAKSKTICNRLSSMRAKRMLNLLKKPVNWELSSFKNVMYDYFDSVFGFGSEIKLSVLGNIYRNNFMSFYAQIAPQIANFNLKPNGYYFYLRFNGSEKLSSIFRQNRESSVWPNLLNLLDGYDFKNEFITIHHGHITSLQFDNNIRNILNGNKVEKESFSVAQMITGEYIMPTLIGIPVTFNVHMPTIEKSKLNIIQLDFYTFDIKYNTTVWNQHTYGIEAYNPIEDSWHGCRRFHIYESNIPFEMIYSETDSPYKIEINIDINNLQQFGVQTFVFSDVFLFSDHQNLESMKSFCGDCKPRYIVSQGDDKKKKHVVLKNNDDSYLAYDISYFECEQSLTPKDISAIKRNILQTHNKNWGEYSFMTIPLTLRQLSMYSKLLPGKGMCGFGMLFKPNLDRILIHLDFSENFTSNYINSFDKNYINIWVKLERDNDQFNPSYDIKVQTDNNNFSIDALMTGKENYKICMYGKKIWHEEEFDQQLSIYAGHNFEDKCDYNETVIEIVTKGMKSEQQVTNEHLHDLSIEGCKSDKLYLHPVTCIAEQTNLRRFEYYIRYNNLPKIIQMYASDISDMIRNNFGEYFERLPENQTAEDLKVIMEYPFDIEYASKTMDLYVQTKTEHYKYKNMPYDIFSWAPFVKLYSRYITYYQSAFGGLKQFDTCNIEAGHLKNVYGEYSNITKSSSWVDLVERDIILLISTKDIDDNMKVLRIISYNDTLTVTLKKDTMEVLLNDVQLNHSETGYYPLEWFSYKISKSNKKIFLLSTLPNFYVEFNGEYIKMLLPFKTSPSEGKCYEHK